MHQQWNEVYKRDGRVFEKVQEDMPRLARLFRKHGVKRVLDLGCGTGRHVVFLASRGFEVDGLDIAPEGLRLTRQWLRRRGLRATLKLGSFYRRFPYEDGRFGAVVSTQSMHHGRLGAVRRCIREMARVLSPGGFIFVTVPRARRRTGRWIAPRTCLPVDGKEKGLPHYFFNRRLIRKEFRGFRIHDIWLATAKHYCILGTLR
ncbi:MAG: class I SAM-dependent methyltransferase [Planctomycetota bacterium]|nr:class I SAM-dependent methyltransferase [Planctomycetota bacterium]